MRELDFDIGASQDAGKAFYRALIIYSSFRALKSL